MSGDPALQYIGADGQVMLIDTDVDGVVTKILRLPPSMLAAAAAFGPNVRPILPADAAAIGNWPFWRIVDGVLERMAEPETPLSLAKAVAETEIDKRAEQARARFLTSGSGQTMEYLATRDESVALIAAGGTPNPALYPFLVAEQSALAAVGTIVTLTEIANDVVLNTAAWTYAGALIKELRRTSKLQVQAATTLTEIPGIVDAISWPEPP